MNKKVTKEDLENLSLKFGGDSKYVKQRRLKEQYPWLVSRDELNKELLRIAECFSDCLKDKDAWCEFKPLLKSFMDAHGLAGAFDFEIELSKVLYFHFADFLDVFGASDEGFSPVDIR